jgi:hypothetical protein
MPDLPPALYLVDGEDRFVPTELTRGPWDPGHQHGGPPSALLARAVERAGQIAPGQLARATFDFLRPVPLAPLLVSARVLRPGRRVEQVEATLSRAGDGEPVMRMRAWRMRVEAVALPDGLGVPDPPPADREHGYESSLGAAFSADIAYHEALDWRFVEGAFDRPGPAIAWARLRVPLVEGEEPAPIERLLVMADAASGISAVLPWGSWQFANVDLSIALERSPEGEWMAMAARTRPGDAGAAVCSAVLSDARGRVGLSTQSLLVMAL